MNGRLIRVRPYGRLGNQMFQHMLADVLRRRIEGARIVGSHMPDWDISLPDREPPASFSVHLRGHVVPLDEIVAFANSVTHVDILVETLSCRVGYYADDREELLKLFPEAEAPEKIGPDELAINVRLDEILSGRHEGYMPLPIVWYERLVAETGLKPVFVGQLGDDRYSQALKARFPDARMIIDLPPRATFETLRTAKHIAISISTFSWLAAWLSKNAETIHMPIAGLYHPLARPDQDLLPVGDHRYRFYDTPLESWSGEDRQLEALISGAIPTPAISHEAVVRRSADTLGEAGVALGGPALR